MKRARKEIPIETLRELVRYDPETGHLYWLPRSQTNGTWRDTARWNGKKAGKPAITATRNGYFSSTILYQNVYAHRVAWALHYGEWPKGEVDHINGDRKDNRIVNLRDVPRSENKKNVRRQANNASGITGVRWHVECKKWAAEIQVDGKRHYLGVFQNIEDAIAARTAAERAHGFHENHGKARP